MENDDLMKNFSSMYKKTCNVRKCEDTPEVMELRKQRDEYTRLAREYQDKIDEAILKTHATPDIIGKFVIIPCDMSNSYIHGRVSFVERLFDGIRVYFDFSFEEILTKTCKTIHVISSIGGKNGEFVFVKWDKLSKIEINSREEFINTFNDYNKKILKHLDYEITDLD